MNKQSLMSPQRKRERALFLYASALQNGDFDTVSAVLRLAERDAMLDQMLKDFDSLAAVPEAREESPSRPVQIGKGIQQNITIHQTSPNGRPSELDQSQEDTDMMLYTTFDSAIPENPKTLYPFVVRFVTLAAAIFVIVLVGGLLIEMVNDPVDGYPALVNLQTEEPTCVGSNDYLAAGKTSFAAGNYEAAAAAFGCAIEIDPTNYVAYMWRGGLAAANGDYDQLALDMYAIEIHRSKGTDPLEVAIATEGNALDDIIESRPDDFVPYVLRAVAGWIPFEGGVPRRNLDRMIELQPENPLGHLFLGAINISSADSIPEAFAQGVALAPDTVLIDWLLRRNEFQFVDVEEQKARLDRAIERNPDHPFAYHFRAQDYVQLGDFAAAAQDFYRHLQINQLEQVEVEGLAPGERIAMEGVAGRVFQLPFMAQSGQKLSLRPDENRNNNGIINPIVVLDAQGNPVAVPYLTTSVNVVISDWEVPKYGRYTVLLMSSSDTELTINVESQGITYHSSVFELPLTVLYPRDWHILEEYSDVVTFMGLQRPSVDLGFMTLENTTIASPEAPYSAMPFPDDFVTWIQSHRLFQVDEVQPTVVGDAQGTQIDVTSTAECGRRKNWIFLSRTGWNCTEGQRMRFIYLPDVDGQPILVLMTTGELTSVGLGAGQEEAEAIIDSAAFTR